MRVPKYVRPIKSVEEHDLTRTEIVVRMFIFAPLFLLFALPVAVAGFFLALGAPFWLHGAINLFSNPGSHPEELFWTVAAIVFIALSAAMAFIIGRNFMRFG